MVAIEDAPFEAQRAGIGESLVNLSCGLEWGYNSRDTLDYGVIYALSKLRAICRFLTGHDQERGDDATRQ